MTTIQASDFKARCLRILDEVAASGEPVTITKRGRVVARLIPAGACDEDPLHALRGSVRITGDVLEPVVRDQDIELDEEHLP